MIDPQRKQTDEYGEKHIENVNKQIKACELRVSASAICVFYSPLLAQCELFVYAEIEYLWWIGMSVRLNRSQFYWVLSMSLAAIEQSNQINIISKFDSIYV